MNGTSLRPEITYHGPAHGDLPADVDRATAHAVLVDLHRPYSSDDSDQNRAVAAAARYCAPSGYDEPTDDPDRWPVLARRVWTEQHHNLWRVILA